MCVRVRACVRARVRAHIVVVIRASKNRIIINKHLFKNDDDKKKYHRSTPCWSDNRLYIFTGCSNGILIGSKTMNYGLGESLIIGGL